MFDNLCPICGFDLGFKAWDGDSPSDEICPCCGIQFGYSDFAGGSLEKREMLYKKWRQRWIEDGLPWRDAKDPPLEWRPHEQLARVYKSLN